MESGNSLDPSLSDGAKEGVDPKLGDLSDSTAVPLNASEVQSSSILSGQHLDAAAEPISYSGDHNILGHQVDTQDIGDSDLTGTTSDTDIPEEKKSGAVTITILPQTASNPNIVHDVELGEPGLTIDHGSLELGQPKTVGIPKPQEQVPNVEAPIHSEDEVIHAQPSTSANKPLTKDLLLSEPTEQPSQKLPQHPAEAPKLSKDVPGTLGADPTLPNDPEVHLDPTQKDSHHGKSSEMVDVPQHREDVKDSEAPQKDGGQKEKPTKMRERFTQIQQYLPNLPQRRKTKSGAEAPTTAAPTEDPLPPEETPTTGKDTAAKEAVTAGKLQKGKLQSARDWAFGKKAAETTEPEGLVEKTAPGETLTTDKPPKGKTGAAKLFPQRKAAGDGGDTEPYRLTSSLNGRSDNVPENVIIVDIAILLDLDESNPDKPSESDAPPDKSNTDAQQGAFSGADLGQRDRGRTSSKGDVGLRKPSTDEGAIPRRQSTTPASDTAKHVGDPSRVGGKIEGKLHPPGSDPADPGSAAGANKNGKAIAQPTLAAEQHAPKTDGPKIDAPGTDGPKIDAPKTDGPKIDAPKTDGPKIDASKAKRPENLVKVPDVVQPEAGSSSQHAARKSFDDDDDNEATSHSDVRRRSSAVALSQTSEAESQLESRSTSRHGRRSEVTGSTGRRSTDGKTPLGHYLLPRGVLDARMLMFAYDSPRRIRKPDEFLNETANKFLKLLLEERKKGDSKVPIVFLAHGFGCLVLQRAIALLAGENAEFREASTYILDQTVGIIFANALFPETEAESNDASVPRGSNTGITAPLKGWIDKKSINAGNIWKSFYAKVHSTTVIPIVWFYSSSEKHSSKSATEPKVSGILFKDIKAKTTSKSSKSRSQRDPEPKDVVERIKGFLVYRAAGSENLQSDLERYVKLDFPLNVQDDNGQSPLHKATLIGHKNGIRILLSSGTAKTLIRDNLLKTPLHYAVEKAAKVGLTESEFPERDKWRAIMQQLRSDFAVLKLKDQEYRTPSSYADGILWIKDALAIPGSWELKTVADQDPWKVPEEGGIQCKQGNRFNTLQPETPSVYELIYQKDCTAKTFSLAPSVDFTCRWVHVPANNERWLHDLFACLRIRDDSMKLRRYKGRQPWDRYMVRAAMKYKQFHIPESDESKPQADKETDALGPEEPPAGKEPKKAEAFAIFMPILSYERRKQWQNFSSAIEDASMRNKEPDDYSKEKTNENIHRSLILGYLNDKLPLHCRRTLHQFYYPMLKSTESRDKHQVASRWAKNHSNEKSNVDHYPIIMVDQLWLWVLHNGTVISSFSDPWDPDNANSDTNMRESYTLKDVIQEALGGKNSTFIDSAEGLVHLILRNGLDFFELEGPLGMKFQDCFQASINDVASELTEQLRAFKKTTTSLNEREVKYNAKKRAKLSNKLFKLNSETQLLVMIMEIQDQLNIVKAVLTYQLEVLQALGRAFPHSKDSDNNKHAEETEKGEKTHKPNPDKKVHWPDQHDDEHIVFKEHHLLRENIAIVDVNIKSVNSMHDYAVKVEEEIKNLIDLKQKHANAWEARFAREGSEETQKQANIMLVFTIVTIIFLPMSFLAAFFAIPTDSVPKDGWPIRKVSGYLFGISVALFVPMIFIAFFVNRISRSAKYIIHNIPGREDIWKFFIWLVGEKEIPTEDDDDDDDQDESDDDDDFEKERKPERVITREHRYAKLLGRFTFHKSIPILRIFWRYYPRIPPEYDMPELTEDYPLRRFHAETARFTRRLIRLLCCFLPEKFLPRPPEHREFVIDTEPEFPNYTLPITIQDTQLEPESPDFDGLFFSSSPTPPYAAGDDPIRRISSPTYEAPIASRSLNFGYGQSITSDFAEDYFSGNVRGRNVLSRPLDSHMRRFDVV